MLKSVSFGGKLLEEWEYCLAYLPMVLEMDTHTYPQGSFVPSPLEWPLPESHKCDLA